MYVPTTTGMSDTMNHRQHPFPLSRFKTPLRRNSPLPLTSHCQSSSFPPKTGNNPPLNISPQHLPNISPQHPPSPALFLPSPPYPPASHPTSQPTSLLPPTRRIIPRSPSSIIIVSTSIRVYTQFSKTLEPPTPTPSIPPSIPKVGREDVLE